jgi:hypothetical protein
MYQRCIKDVSKMYQRCLKDVSENTCSIKRPLTLRHVPAPYGLNVNAALNGMFVLFSYQHQPTAALPVEALNHCEKMQ